MTATEEIQTGCGNDRLEENAVVFPALGFLNRNRQNFQEVFVDFVPNLFPHTKIKYRIPERAMDGPVLPDKELRGKVIWLVRDQGGQDRRRIFSPQVNDLLEGRF